MTQQPFRFTLFLLICVLIPLTAMAQTVNIPDPNLRAEIEKTLGKASGATITAADMARLTDLRAPNANIRNLTGLEDAINLTNLDLSDEYVEAEGRYINSNSVSDLSPLSGLTNLSSLWLQRNAISDISPLAGLTKLTDLWLWHNNITDISPVASLTNLTRLHLGTNLISDISAVTGLTNLTFLDFREQSISDISALSGLTNLTSLDLGANSVSDISALFGLTNLTHLSLVINSISDISALSGLTKLTWLHLWDNSISDLSPLVANTGLGSGDEVYVWTNPLNRASIKTHIPALQSRGVTVEFDNVIAELVNIPDPNLRAAVENNLGKASGDPITTADMAKLTRLEAKNANISNLTGLEFATNLTELDLSAEYVEAERSYINSNSVSDLSPISGLTQLRGLRLQYNNITDISAVAGLTNLIQLRLSSNSISDISAVAGLTNLTSLNLSSNPLSDISALAGLTNLEDLEIVFNNISDISAVAGLTNLTRLDLGVNSVSDISAVAGLTNLTRLDLGVNSVSDISAVAGLTNLIFLNLGYNIISDISAVAGLTNLGGLYLWDNDISDISAVAGLTNLTYLYLGNNSISDISPLVANTGLRGEDTVNVQGNPLNHTSINTHIPTLQSRGVTVELDADDDDLADDEELVNIPDPNLRAAIEKALDKASGSTITTADMESLTELRAPNANINDLTGLEEATNLTRLDLGAEYVEAEQRSINSNSVSDLSPLAGLTNLTWLRLRNNSISDLSALAGLTNLTWLNLGGNLMISDISALSGLINLETLWLYGNSISDLSPLAGLTNLTYLYLWFNSISDLSPLAGLTNLTWLELYNNLILDLSPLAGLANLTRLALSNHPTFIPSTGLTHLISININNNAISDLSPLVGLTNLRDLYLYNNAISDLSPLVTNTGLGNGDSIEVWGNPLNDASLQTHIPALQSRGVTVEFILTPTTLLKISGTVTESDNLLIVEVRDNRNRPVEGVPVTFTVISGGGTLSVTNTTTSANGRAESRLTLGPNAGTNRVRANVEGLAQTVTFIDASRVVVNIPDANLRAAIENALGKASGADITASDMANLTELRASNANISNLTGLEFAINLTRLFLSGEILERQLVNSNSVSNLSPLAGLINLTFLHLDDNSISDISPLSGLTNLIELWLYGNSISDISALAGLTNLTSLGISDNSIPNISPVKGLTNLTSLWVSDNSISDISPVKRLTKLTALNFRDNSISDISPVKELTNLIYLDFANNSITDISHLRGLANLRSLYLSNNSITDISSLIGLTSLNYLILGNNSIADISPLVANTGLGPRDTIHVWGNPLNYASIYTHIPTLQNRGAGVGFDDQASDFSMGSAKAILTGHTDGVDSVAFSRDGTLASGSRDGTVRLWDGATGQLKATLTGHRDGVRSIAVSPDGAMVASGSRDGVILLWDVATGEIIHTFTEHTAMVESVAFSPDGSMLASGGHDNTMYVWDIATGQRPFTFNNPSGIWGVAFSPEGTLAIGSGDGKIHLWDVVNIIPKAPLAGHTAWVESVAFSPDGSTLASGSGDNTVRLWDVATGESKATLTGHTAGVNSVAFSPDGTTLASGADDNTVWLWDAVTGQPKATFTGHTSWVRSVAFSPDGTTLASGSGDSTIILWEIAPPTITEYLLSIPTGISLIHIPLKVTAVDGVEQSITSIADLYDALGGAENVNFLVTRDSQWRSYVGASDKGTPADAILTDDKGIIASMKTPTALRLSGTPLGTGGSSTITLHPGLNVVGLPLNDSRITRVSDLFTLDGIQDNVPVIILSDNGDFKTVGRAGDPGDIEVTGGQAFILNAQQAATVAISGEGWANGSDTTAAPLIGNSLLQRDTTPVLALRGAVVDEATHSKVKGFRVTVKNLSTGRAVTGMTRAEGVGYQLTVVAVETGRAARIGDILEITAQSPHPLAGVEPLRYTITAEDVKQSLIQLPDLILYEIPSDTELLQNYPNPFNPETWIPYRLAEDAFVTLTIYDTAGRVVRTIDVGHRVAAVYESRSKAAYWDGRNKFGEAVASGVYFYHLSAGDYSATRRMVILK